MTGRDERPVTASYRIVDNGLGAPHIRVQVFVGRTPGSRGLAGELKMTREEWDRLGHTGMAGNRVIELEEA